MKNLVVLAVILVTSCSSKDEKFCECIAIGEEFNTKSNEVLNNIDKEFDQEALQALKEKKDQACADYITMGGDEMRKKMEDCE